MLSMSKKAIVLHVLEENTSARPFYDNCGFAFDGAREEADCRKQLVAIRYRRKM